MASSGGLTAHNAVNPPSDCWFSCDAAARCVWNDLDDRRVVRGHARLLPTTRPYMLETHWPHLVADGRLPRSEGIVEVTRVCVDKTVDPVLRRTIFPELLCAIQEIPLESGGLGMIGVTREHLLSHFVREGIEWLGPAEEVEGEIERAFFVPTASIRPDYHCRKYGIARRVLAPADQPLRAPQAA